jgi:hypothetical protein
MSRICVDVVRWVLINNGRNLHLGITILWFIISEKLSYAHESEKKFRGIFIKKPQPKLRSYKMN